MAETERRWLDLEGRRQRSADAFFALAPEALFAYEDASKAAWEKRAKDDEVDSLEAIVHRVEAPGFVDLSHPFSFDKIENPVSLDSREGSEASSSDDSPVDEGRRRITIKLPRGALRRAAADDLDLDEATCDVLDREIVATIAADPSSSSSRAAADDAPPKDDDARDGYVGAYSREARKARVALFHRKRARRVWTKKVKYDVRKNFADSRMRVKGRFVKKEDEDLLRDLVAIV
mmetsp:Transcript_11486/g.29186  ORF Transcript_11486/g.29186 Transcript_11486/m.29186 type:complete len:233 (+) Transcript_11486:176-874(+)